MVSLEIFFVMFCIVVFATMVKSMAGFADGMIMVSLFLLFLDIKVALPVILIIALLTDVYILRKVYKDADKKIVGMLFATAIIGGIIGTYILNNVNSDIIITFFAFFIMIFAVKVFFSKQPKKTNKDGMWALIAGFFSGILDGMQGTGGPPVVMYLSQRAIQKTVFRATCVLIFFLIHLVRLVTYSATGIMTTSALTTGLLLVPAVIIGAVIGFKLHKKVDQPVFKKIVACLLFCLGITLLL